MGLHIVATPTSPKGNLTFTYVTIDQNIQRGLAMVKFTSRLNYQIVYKMSYLITSDLERLYFALHIKTFVFYKI